MKIAVAMSGGVDSSVTAALLKKEGHEVFGLTMLVTPSDEAAVAAREAAAALGIPHYTVDFSDILTGRSSLQFACNIALAGRRTPVSIATVSSSSVCCWPKPSRFGRRCHGHRPLCPYRKTIGYRQIYH